MPRGRRGDCPTSSVEKGTIYRGWEVCLQPLGSSSGNGEDSKRVRDWVQKVPNVSWAVAGWA